MKKLYELRPEERNLPFNLGLFQVIKYPSPAVATNFTLTVPDGVIWNVNSLRFSLQADANVANRTVSISFSDDNGTVLFVASSNFSQPASQLDYYNFVSDGQDNPGGYNQNLTVRLPSTLYLPERYTIKSICLAIQAGDQFSGITLWVREFDRLFLRGLRRGM